MDYDLRPRIRHWIAIGSGAAAVTAIGLTAQFSHVTPLVVTCVAAWLALNLVVLWHSDRLHASRLTVVLAAATVLAQSQTASPANIMLYAVMAMTVLVTLPLRYSAAIIATVGLYIATLAQPTPSRT